MRRADPYLTAEALGIEERTRTGLIRLARDLADGTVPPERFDMSEWCGTACCIGGHLRMRGDIPPMNYLDISLFELFYALGVGTPLSKIPPAAASRAIINFLTTGDPDWAGAMRGPVR